MILIVTSRSRWQFIIGPSTIITAVIITPSKGAPLQFSKNKTAADPSNSEGQQSVRLPSNPSTTPTRVYLDRGAKAKPLPGSTRTGGQEQKLHPGLPGHEGQSKPSARIHPSTETRANPLTRIPEQKSKSSNSTLLPHIGNLYKGVGGK